MEHVTEVVARLPRPILVGPRSVGPSPRSSLGGLAAGTVAIAPAPFRGVSGQFGFAFADALSESEPDELYERYCVPAPGRPLFQSALANWRPRCGSTPSSHSLCIDHEWSGVAETALAFLGRHDL